MRLSLYFKTIRWTGLALGLFYPLQIWLYFIASRARYWDWTHFFGATIALPFTVGLVIASVVAGLMHKPFFMLLPGARRYYLKAQAIVVAVCTGLLTWYAGYTLPELPSAGAWGLIVASMSSVMLAWEAGFKWRGAKRPILICAASGAVICWQAAAIHAAACQWPWVFAAGGVVVAVVSFAAGFSRERLRGVALSDDFVSPITVLFNRKAMQAQQVRALTLGKYAGAEWPRAAVEPTLRSWMKVIHHAGPIVPIPRVKQVSLIVLLLGVGIVLPAVIVDHFARHHALTIHSIAEHIRASFWGKEMPFAVLMIFGMVPMNALFVFMHFPNPLHGYPLSRERRMQLVLAMTARLMAGYVVSVYLTVLAASWLVCRLANVEFALAPVPIFAVPLVTVPLIPVIILLGMKSASRGMPMGNDSLVMVIAPILAMSAAALSIQAAWIFTVPGLLTVTGVLLLMGALYVHRVRRIYLHGDLVGRTA